MSPIARYGSLTLAAASVTLVLIMLGGAVCFLGAAKAIPDWPATFGGIAPPVGPGALVEYLHRVAAALAGLLVLASAVIGIVRFRSVPWLSVPPAVSVVLLAVVATLGALVVLSGIPPALAAVDLASALMVLALMVATTLTARFARRVPGHAGRLVFRSPFARLGLASGVSLYIVLATGLSVGTPAPANCLGLPLWGSLFTAAGRRGWLWLSQLGLSGAAGILIIATALLAWRWRRAEAVPLSLATSAAALYVAALLTGELAARRAFPIPLMAIRVLTAAALWGTLVALVAWEGLRGAAPARGATGSTP